MGIDYVLVDFPTRNKYDIDKTFNAIEKYKCIYQSTKVVSFGWFTKFPVVSVLVPEYSIFKMQKELL